MSDDEVELIPRIFAGQPPTLFPRPNWILEAQERKQRELAAAEERRAQADAD